MVPGVQPLVETLSLPTAERREVADLRETGKPQIYVALDGKEQGQLARRGLLVSVQTFQPR